MLSGLYTPDEMAQAQECRGAVAAGGLANQQPPQTITGDDPAQILDSVGQVSSEPSHDGESRDSEHGGVSLLSPAVPLPLQPFVDQGMNRRNIQAAFGFIQAELERALGPEGTAVFRRLWLQLPRTFKTKEEAKLRTVACWVAMWGYVEAAEERRAA